MFDSLNGKKGNLFLTILLYTAIGLLPGKSYGLDLETNQLKDFIENNCPNKIMLLYLPYTVAGGTDIIFRYLFQPDSLIVNVNDADGVLQMVGRKDVEWLPNKIIEQKGQGVPLRAYYFLGPTLKKFSQRVDEDSPNCSLFTMLGASYFSHLLNNTGSTIKKIEGLALVAKSEEGRGFILQNDKFKEYEAKDPSNPKNNLVNTLGLYVHTDMAPEVKSLVSAYLAKKISSVNFNQYTKDTLAKTKTTVTYGNSQILEQEWKSLYQKMSERFNLNK